MKNIKISNFRKIRDIWDLDLAPITFFTGTNNSGKSTVFKALLLIEDYVNSTNHFELSFNGLNSKKLRIDSYSNAINNENLGSNLELVIEYSNGDHLVKLQFTPDEIIEDDIMPKGKLKKLSIVRKDDVEFNIENIGGDNYILNVNYNLINDKQENQNIDQNSLLNSVNKLLIKLKSERQAIEWNKTNLINRKEIISKEIDVAMTYSKEISKKPIRLHKLLKELNITVGDVTHFLNQKNVEISNHTNEKIPLDICYLIIDWFSNNPLQKKKVILKVFHPSYYYEIDRINVKIKEYNKESISIMNQIDNTEKKLKELSKSLFDKKTDKKDSLILSPKFSLSENIDSDYSISKVIRDVLPKYLRTNKKLIGNSDIQDETYKAVLFGDKINKILTFSVSHLSPNRNSQTRLYLNRNSDTDIFELIGSHLITPLNKESDAAEFLKNWMSKFDIGTDYKITSYEGVASKIEIEHQDKWYNLADKGFGAGQIFTILLKIALQINALNLSKKTKTAIILIEEPEANLHPALQSKLTDLFYAVNKEYGIRFVIETHSEYALRKSQLIVKNLFENNRAAGEFPFSVYYFDEVKGPYKMNYRQDGKFIDEFGSGFFDVSTNLAFEIM